MCLIFWWKDDCKTRPLFLALLLLFTFFTVFSFLLCVLISWCPFVCRPLCSLLIPFCLAFVPWPFRFDFCYLRALWCSSVCVCVCTQKEKKSLGRTYHWPFLLLRACMHTVARVPVKYVLYAYLLCVCNRDAFMALLQACRRFCLILFI